MGITEDKILYSWGSNFNGTLGDNTTVSKSSPVTVVGGITNWKQVSAADRHTLALTEDGKIYSWGSNSSGSLGNDTASSNLSSPVTIVGGIANWSSLSTMRHFHSIALSTTSKGFNEP